MTDTHPLDRRGFLLASAATALGACAATRTRAGDGPSRIAAIELWALRYPMTGYFKFFDSAGGRAGRAAVLVAVTDDDGRTGWGQSVPIARWSDETLETAFVALRDYFAPALLGADPDDLDRAQALLDGAVAPGFSTGMPITRAGLDLALHDLTGKRRGLGMAELWGRPRGGPIELSWTVNVRALAEVDGVVTAGRARGYRHFNIKVAPDVEFDVALARTVRGLAPDAFLWADANGGYDEATALAAAPRLADAGVDVLEAPLRPNRISGYRALKKQGALPILMDEGIVSVVELKEFADLGMLDGVAMKPSRCGGLLSARRQIEFLAERGMMWLGSGLTDPDVSLAATLALYGAYGLRRPAALNGPQFLAEDLAQVPVRVVGGQLAVPEGPGLGLEIDRARLADLLARTGHGHARIGRPD